MMTYATWTIAPSATLSDNAAMGNRNLGICPNIFRLLFCIVNFCILVIGVLGFALSIYLIVVNSYFTFVPDNTVLSGAVLILVASLCIFVITAIGFIGAVFKLRVFLIIYAVILTIIILLELIGGILSYVFRDSLRSIAEDQLASSLEDQISKYRRNQDDPGYEPSVNSAVDFIQRTFMCCGAGNGSIDWAEQNPSYLRSNNLMLPASCDCIFDDPKCDNVTFPVFINKTYYGDVAQLAWNDSCVAGTQNKVLELAIIAGGVGIAFGILELLGVLVAVGLCLCISTAGTGEDGEVMI